MSIISHYSFFPGLFVAYHKRPAFLCILLPFLGLSFRHLPQNLSNFTSLAFASRTLLSQISGTWSNHEGSIFSWCWILYGFLLCYRAQRGYRELAPSAFVSNFVRHRSDRRCSRRSSELPSRRNRFGREGTTLLLYRDERYCYIEEQRIYGALGIALFFSPFLSGSSDPFVRNLFVRTEPLAESNPVPQDPLSAIHPPRIYAGDVASAMGFGLCRSKMLNRIVALTPMRKGTLLRGSRILQHCVGPALRSNRSWFAFYSLWTGALMDTGREQAKRVAYNSNRDGTTTLTLCWTNTVFSDQDQVRSIRIWILTCRFFFTVGILPGSWWAHHELGRGGWWFRDPVENASFMPWVLATARIHSVILPLLHSWTSLLNTLTLPCCVSGTFEIRSGLLAPVHSSATDDTRGILLWFLFITGISMNLFYQMKHQASVLRIYQKDMVVARSTLVHLRH